MSASSNTTAGKPITCKAAVMWEAKTPYVIEDVEVAPPKKGEVRIKILFNACCHTDAYTASGQDPEGVFPAILGHEGCGIVESVGEGVTSVKEGDKVIPLYTAECQKCFMCKSNKTNLCSAVRATQGRGLMPDETVRFTCKGKKLFHFMGTSCFSQYTVLPEVSVAKVQDDAPEEKVCLLGCGVTTGYNSVFKTANVQKGDTAAVFGCGAVGIAVIQGLRTAGASKIIAIDLNEEKFVLAKKLGATHCVNPSKLPDDTTIVQKVVEMTKTDEDNVGGVDHSFECIGNTKVMDDALMCVHKGWGQSIIIGVAPSGKTLGVRPFHLVIGKVWKGTAFGGTKGRTELPGLVEAAMKGDIDLDSFITHRMPLSKVNDAFDLMHQGKSIRTVIDMWSDQ
mmetsp:Transcript_15287/g.22874  ORF Transcript_15287/g.22874 Transcript_15287/m.22874 type:complete len:394 (+) Transcript_15287:23-1204(+)|eukprot:CAMPEP_0201551980 /NCGR_PEP_ID=MMETSP0173_2-20130828/12175_1 /ASSEMBLY_ACC=CAM_ASM_000268 /TAXON_ID=218659 /ORGANISM="Vexillifera sp., Strain DIVA3 564/2" /LENGTH=393 /DNA_ID=CAMNT_0047962359 /DNA_START=6 /DNA_END=1187 /DNA_ORIENTATION=+